MYVAKNYGDGYRKVKKNFKSFKDADKYACGLKKPFRIFKESVVRELMK